MMGPTKIDLPKLEVVEAYQNGYSFDRLARNHGCSSSTIRNRLKEWKIPLESGRKSSYRDPSIKIPFDNSVLAYIAGLFDGEGTLSGIALEIGNNCRKVLEYVKLHVGGGRIYKSFTKKGTPTFTWNLGVAADRYVFLRSLIPYMIIRKNDALEALRRLEATLPIPVKDAITEIFDDALLNSWLRGGRLTIS